MIYVACPEIRREPRSTSPGLIRKIPARSGSQIPSLSESIAQHPRRPLAPFLGLAPTCPKETRRICHSPSPLLLPTDHRPLTTTHYSLKSFRYNTYASPRKCCKQKTYAVAKPFRCNTYKKQGVLLQAKCFSLSSPRRLFLSLPFSVHSSKFPYPVSPLLATLPKTPGVWGYSSHFGTRAR